MTKERRRREEADRNHRLSAASKLALIVLGGMAVVGWVLILAP